MSTIRVVGIDIAKSVFHGSRQILSSRRGLSEGLRADAAKVTVTPGPVVEHFNVIEDIGPGQIPGFIDAFSDPFFFQ